MDFETVKAWLAGQVEKQARSCRLKGIAGCILCPIALLVCAGLIFGLLEMFSRRHDWEGNNVLLLIVSFAMLPFLFLGNWLISPGKLYEEQFTGDALATASVRYGPGRGMVILLVLAWILFTGPQLLAWALKSFKEARRWREQDTHSCAAVIWLLASRHKRVSVEEVEREIPWINLDSTFPQLARITGFLYLKGPPEGFSLTDGMRAAIRTGGDLEESYQGFQLS